MKNVKYWGFVGLGCALLLTGCGGKKADIHCTGKADFGNFDAYIYLSDGKVSDAYIEYSYSSQDEAEAVYSEINRHDSLKEEGDFSLRGKKIIVENYRGDHIGFSKEEFIEFIEENGGACE